MPTALKKGLSHQRKKIRGLHHNQGKHYSRVYWPYLPLLLLVAVGAFIQLFPARWDILAYATDISPSSLLQETNNKRTLAGSGLLNLDERLNSAAQAKANDMAKRNYWSHTTPEGKDPWVFVADAGYSYQKAGENLAYGFTSTSSTVNGWMNSPSHRTNMLDESYQHVGFGFANVGNFQEKGEVTVVVAMYGRASGSPVIASHINKAKSQPLTSTAPIRNTAVKPVSFAQTVTGGQTSWLPFAIGLISGLALAVLIIRHGLALRRLAIKSEVFVLHHPLFDLTLVIVVLIGLYLRRTAGFIT